MNLALFPLISVLFAAAWVCLIFCGHWTGRGKNPQNSKEEFLSPAATKSLQGLAAFAVLCHHLSQTPYFGQLNEIQAFKDTGFLFVAIFFFCSGFGLIKSLNTRPGYLNGFLKRSLPKVIVPFYVMNVFCIAYNIWLGTKMSAVQWFCMVTGITLLNDNAWFVPVIAIMYTAFYFIFKNEKAGEKNARVKSFALIFVVIAAQVGWFLFNKHFVWWIGPKDWWKAPGALWTAPWWQRIVALWYEGEWWVESTIAFLLGMLVAEYEKKFVEFFSRRYLLKVILVAVTFAFSMFLYYFAQSKGIHYWLEFSGDNSTRPRAIMMAINTLQALSFCLLVVLIMMKNYADNKATQFLGRHSLELYLMQVMPLRGFQVIFGLADKSLHQTKKLNPELFSDRLSILFYTACVVLASALLAVLLRFLCQKILARKPRAE